MNGFALFVFRLLKVSALGIGSLAVVLGLVYGGLALRRPARTAEKRSLFQGIQYERYARQSPRPLLFHMVTIDLTAPGLRFLVTPQSIDPGEQETLADTVPGFLKNRVCRLRLTATFSIPNTCIRHLTTRPMWVKA